MKRLTVLFLCLTLSSGAFAGNVRYLVGTHLFCIVVGSYARHEAMRINRKAYKTDLDWKRDKLTHASRQYNHGANLWFIASVALPVAVWGTSRVEVRQEGGISSIRYNYRFR